MVKPKVESITHELSVLADLAKALSHPVRIKILQILTEKKTCICGDIVNLLPLAQSTVSQHLKELKRVGLIKGEIEGPRTCYCVNLEMLSETRKIFSELFSQLCQHESKGD